MMMAELIRDEMREYLGAASPARREEVRGMATRKLAGAAGKEGLDGEAEHARITLEVLNELEGESPAP